MSAIWSNWSDGTKWVMGIIAALVGAGIIALVTFAWETATSPSPALFNDELEVHNEWVIRISIVESLDRAAVQKAEFKALYEASGDDVWINDIRVVRSPSEKGKWYVVIDTFPGRSSQSTVERELDRLTMLANSSRDLANTLGTWFIGAEAIDWNLEEFSSIYGRPTNYPSGERYTRRDDDETG